MKLIPEKGDCIPLWCDGYRTLRVYSVGTITRNGKTYYSLDGVWTDDLTRTAFNVEVSGKVLESDYFLTNWTIHQIGGPPRNK